MTTYVAWEGPSQLDGSPIVLLVSMRTDGANVKTGQVAQTYILRADMKPTDALREGQDTAICGDCPFRSKASGGTGACYVVVHQGPLSVWSAWKRGNAPRFDASMLAGWVLRLGTYGDPAAVPSHVWEPLVAASSGHTGYTHQWRQVWAQEYSRWCMASVETTDDLALATAMGWRGYRAMLPGVERTRGEMVCPASAEAGKRLTCAECLRCGGSDGPGSVSVAITIHGSMGLAQAKRGNLDEVMSS